MQGLPSELVLTTQLLCLFQVMGTDGGTIMWPEIDEDQIALHSRSWYDAATTLTATTDGPMAEKGTIWDKGMPWDRGHDPALDAFVQFWENNPRAHYRGAAKQATAVAGALNGVAGFITSYKSSYIQIASAAREILTQTYHVLGPVSHLSWFWSGSENQKSFNWPAPSFTTIPTEAQIEAVLKQIAPNETAGHRTEDGQMIAACCTSLRDLGTNTRAFIADYEKIIDQARATITELGTSAEAAAGRLPDQSFTKQNPVSDYNNVANSANESENGPPQPVGGPYS